MVYFKIIQLAIKNVMSSRKKTLAAILSVASGFIALNLFEAYIFDTNILFDRTYENRSMYGDLLIRKESRLDNTTIEEQGPIDSFLKEHSGQIDVGVPFLNFSGALNTGSLQIIFSGVGYDPEMGRRMRDPYWGWNTLAGAPLDDAFKQSSATDHIIVVGRRLAEIIGCSEDENYHPKINKNGYEAKNRTFHCEHKSVQISLMTETGQINAAEVEIVGIVDGVFSDLDQRLIMAPLSLVQNLMKTKSLSMTSIRLKNKSDIPTLISQFKYVQAKVPALHLKSWRNFDIGDFYIKSIDFLFVFRNFITVVVIFIGTLSVVTTFYRLVFERTREIGTLLSLGFRAQHIFILFLSESFFLSFFGVLIGVFLSYFLALIINAIEIPYKLGMLSDSVAFAMTVSPKTIVFSTFTLILISLLACAFPVRRALYMKVSDALRDSD